jgi:phosphoribosylanthranilate isomerase
VTRVGLKVCGVTRRRDVEACVDLGVDAIGVNLWSGSPRGLELEEAQALLRGIDRKGTRVVGVVVDAEPAFAARAVTVLGLDAVQAHGDRPVQDYTRAGLACVRVVRGTPPLAGLAPAPAGVAWTLLDARVPGFGGAGVRTDWAWARTAVTDLAPHAVWLAGGIGPDDAAEAIAAVGPAGLDVASGAESVGASRGEKDVAAIAALLRICQNGSP